MQHLNLYSQIERTVEPPFSARQQARLVAITAVGMLVIYLLLMLGGGNQKKEVNRLSAQEKRVAARLKQLQEKKARLENNPALDNAIAGLKRDVDFRHRLINSITPQKGAVNGFAEQLAGLARQHIDGMWFTEIQLRDGGRQMALLGQTKKPAYVPEYLQKLSTESVFEGQRFSVLRMYVPEKRKDLHSFELRAKEVGAP